MKYARKQEKFYELKNVSYSSNEMGITHKTKIKGKSGTR